MTPSLIYYLLATAAILLGALNVYLSLRIDNKILLMRQDVMSECDGKYAPEREVGLRFGEVDRRLQNLERRHAS